MPGEFQQLISINLRLFPVGEKSMQQAVKCTQFNAQDEGDVTDLIHLDVQDIPSIMVPAVIVHTVLSQMPASGAHARSPYWYRFDTSVLFQFYREPRAFS